jgi:16S rRNA (uracil1498-N3)-methyltransferase
MSLSNIELYYSQTPVHPNNNLRIIGEEAHHISKVMRHIAGDEVFATNGCGNIFKGQIVQQNDNEVIVEIIEKFSFENKFRNYVFCIPNLKNNSRLEFALEKSVELGITKFVLFNSERTIAKSFKIERFQKILISAMKQSLQSFLPEIISMSTIRDISKLDTKFVIFEQTADRYFDALSIDNNKEYYFIFGPEGGLSQTELNLFNKNDLYKLAENRLRTETAIIKLASSL